LPRLRDRHPWREKSPRLWPLLLGGRVATADPSRRIEKCSRILEEVLGVAFDAAEP
jgi:hypothetical protein